MNYPIVEPKLSTKVFMGGTWAKVFQTLFKKKEVEKINKDNITQTVNHTFEPIYDKNSRILILGTMPSVKSREADFYYMHPQNSFWKVLSNVLEYPFPQTVNQKKEMLSEKGIALWDVLQSCEIAGSLDSSIKNPLPNDLSKIFNVCNIKAVFTNGTKATSLYKRYCQKLSGMESIYLPSTSPANKKYFTYETILDEWKVILKYLESDTN